MIGSRRARTRYALSGVKRQRTDACSVPRKRPSITGHAFTKQNALLTRQFGKTAVSIVVLVAMPMFDAVGQEIAGQFGQADTFAPTHPTKLASAQKNGLVSRKPRLDRRLDDL